MVPKTFYFPNTLLPALERGRRELPRSLLFLLAKLEGSNERVSLLLIKSKLLSTHPLRIIVRTRNEIKLIR
jgi:hypothetical protein